MVKVLVFQSWGLGDMVMTIPMIDSLRGVLPKAKIDAVVGTKEVKAVLEMTGLVDNIKIINTRRKNFDLIRGFLDLRRERFDMAFVGTEITGKACFFLRYLSGVKKVYDGRGKEDLRRVLANMEILRKAFPGAEIGEIGLKVSEEKRKEVDSFLKKSGLKRKEILGIHPGSLRTQKYKRYSVERYVRIAKEFLKEHGKERVLVFLGPEEEKFSELFKEIDNRIVIVLGKDIEFITGLLGKVSVFLGNDSALGHIAAAMNVKTITLVGKTNILKTRPWGNKSKVILGENRDIEKISEREVLKNINLAFMEKEND